MFICLVILECLLGFVCAGIDSNNSPPGPHSYTTIALEAKPEFPWSKRVSEFLPKSSESDQLQPTSLTPNSRAGPSTQVPEPSMTRPAGVTKYLDDLYDATRSFALGSKAKGRGVWLKDQDGGKDYYFDSLRQTKNFLNTTEAILGKRIKDHEIMEVKQKDGTVVARFMPIDPATEPQTLTTGNPNESPSDRRSIGLLLQDIYTQVTEKFANPGSNVHPVTLVDREGIKDFSFPSLTSAQEFLNISRTQLASIIERRKTIELKVGDKVEKRYIATDIDHTDINPLRREIFTAQITDKQIRDAAQALEALRLAGETLHTNETAEDTPPTGLYSSGNISRQLALAEARRGKRKLDELEDSSDTPSVSQTSDSAAPETLTSLNPDNNQMIKDMLLAQSRYSGVLEQTESGAASTKETRPQATSSVSQAVSQAIASNDFPGWVTPQNNPKHPEYEKGKLLDDFADPLDHPPSPWDDDQ